MVTNLKIKNQKIKNKMGYKMKGFSGFGNSPAKQKYNVTWADKDAEKKHNEKIKSKGEN